MAVTQFDGTRQIIPLSITNAVQNFGTPSAAGDVAIKSYVDSLVQGLVTKSNATVATVAALSPTNTYANGTAGLGATLTATGVGVLTVDGHAVLVNEFVLVKNEASGLKNGLYKCTTQGTAGVAYILTRDVDMDTTLEYSGAYIFVQQGSTLASTGWTCTNSTAPTVGTTAITFSQFSGVGTYTGGNGITITGTSVAIDTSITADLSTAQTFTNKTLTSPKLNENVAVTTTATKLNFITSAAGTTGTTSTNIVFSTSPVLTTPTLGVASATSLATSAATPFLLTNGQLVNIALTSQTVGATTLTIPNFASVVDTFAFITLAQTLSNKTFVAPALGTPASGVMTNVTGTASSLTSGITLALKSATTTVDVSAATAPSANQVLTATDSTHATWQTLSSATFQRSTTVSGTQDSANKVFTIGNAVSTLSEQVFLNGQLLTPGGSNDYVISGTTVTFQAAITAPAATDTIRVYGTF